MASRFLGRDVGRLGAILVFAGTCCAIFILTYVMVLITQTSSGPSFLVLPLIGAAVALVPAMAGFALGAPFWGRRYALWRCMALAVLPMMSGALLADPIGNLSPRDPGETAANIAVVLIFVVCACLPLLAKSRAE